MGRIFGWSVRVGFFLSFCCLVMVRYVVYGARSFAVRRVLR